MRRQNAVLDALLGSMMVAMMLAGPTGAATTESADEFVVSLDTTWSGEDRTIEELVVRAPATLRLEGTTLRIGHRIVIEEGASMELGPLGSRATDIGPVDQGTPSKTTGFSMIVNGTLRASGTPATTLHGIRGGGLGDMYAITGGIQVGGQAVLSDVHIHDGNSTLITRRQGTTVLSRVLIERMGFMGAGVYGSLSADNSTLRGSVSGIMGADGCLMQVRDSRIEALAHGISDNSCQLRLERTDIVGGLNGLYLSGSANATVTDTTFTEYTQHGIFTKGREELRPRLMAEGVLLDPMGRQDGAFDGLTLLQTDAELRDSVIRGNTGAGILEKEFGTLDLENVTVVRNGIGLVAIGAEVDGDLLEANDFGEPGSPDENERGQIEATIGAFAFVMDPHNHTLQGGTLKVFGVDQKTAILVTNTTDNSGRIMGTFPAYMRLVTGHSVYLGPFTYEVTHPLLAEPLRGDLDLARPLAIAHIAEGHGTAAGAEESGEPSGKDLPSLGLPALAGALAFAGLLWSPARQRAGPQQRSKK